MEQALDEVEDFLERQGEIVRALAEAKHAEAVLENEQLRWPRTSSLLMRRLDAKLLRNTADKLIAQYEHERPTVI
jgi:hypothetical protein